MKRYALLTMPVTGLISALFPLGLVGPLAFLPTACDPEAGPSAEDARDDADRRSTPAELAERYLFEQVGPDEAEALLQEIRDLDADGLRDFSWWVVEHQRTAFADEIDPLTTELVLRLGEHAAETNRAFFDLSDAEVDEVRERLTGHAAGLRCWPLYKECLFTTLWDKDPVTGLNYSPSSGWIAGYSSDRVSNSSCEEFDCDYRLKFNVGSSKRKNFFAITSAAYCVQGKYNNALSTYKSGSTQYTLVGYYKTSKCGVESGSYLRQNLPLY